MSNSVVSQTLLSTVRAVSTVFLVYLGGFCLVKWKALDDGGVKILSKLTNIFFLPAFFLIRFGGGLSIDSVQYAWPVTIIGVVCVIFYIVLSLPLALFAKPTKRFYRWFLVAQSVPNTAALPLVLINSLCSQVKIETPPYYLNLKAVTEENTQNETETDIEFLSVSECIEIGELYIFLYGLLITILLWIVGFNFLQSDPSSNQVDILEAETSFENTVETSSEALETSSDSQGKKSSYGNELLRGIKVVIEQPTIQAQLVAICIGLIAPVQDLFFGQDAIFSSVTAAVKIISDAAIGILNLIMAATLSLRLLSIEKVSHVFGHESVGVSRRTVGMYVLGRMIVLPGIGMCILYFIEDMILPDDKLMKLVIFIEFGQPSANMVVLLAQILGCSREAETLAMCGLSQYLVGIFSITMFTFLSLLILGIS